MKNKEVQHISQNIRSIVQFFKSEEYREMVTLFREAVPLFKEAVPILKEMLENQKNGQKVNDSA